jgi:hypothetical protein
VTTNPAFWDQFVGSLLLIRYQRAFIIFHLVFPAFGLFLLMTPLLGYRLGPVEILLALVCFSFTPLVTAFAVWLAGRQGKISQGPITYVFDTEGCTPAVRPLLKPSIGQASPACSARRALSSSLLLPPEPTAFPFETSVILTI